VENGQRAELNQVSKTSVSGLNQFSARITIPGGNAMAPPNLSRDTPISNILHPLEIGLFPDLRDDSGTAVSNHLYGLLGQRLGFDKPLEREVRFDDRLTAIAVAYHMVVVLCLN
jgi:hypothetical protein